MAWAGGGIGFREIGGAGPEPRPLQAPSWGCIRRGFLAELWRPRPLRMEHFVLGEWTLPQPSRVLRTHAYRTRHGVGGSESLLLCVEA